VHVAHCNFFALTRNVQLTLQLCQAIKLHDKMAGMTSGHRQ